jgi:hypothetical protein
MSRYYTWIICVACIALCLGCEHGTHGKSSTDIIEMTSGTWTLTKGATAKVIRVSTPQEFVEHIGPNRVLELEPGEYVLSEVQDRRMDFVRWDPNFDGKTLTIRKVENLKIVGIGNKPVRLIVHPRYVFVLNFENCKNVEMVNLVLGHAPDEGYCDSGVVGAVNCEKISIRKCELFGCGTEGLTLTNVRSFSFEDSIIRDCSYGIMTVKNCAGLSFSGSQFIRNHEYYGINLHDTKAVVFNDCVFSKNKIGDTLFRVTSCSDIVVKGGKISDNEVKGLTNNTKVVTFKGVKGI